jgi:hypothetical protein
LIVHNAPSSYKKNGGIKMADEERDLEIDAEKADQVAGGVDKTKLRDPVLEAQAPDAAPDLP